MTEKLYYQDAYQKTFEAVVTKCRESGKGFEIILNKTVFYPEGGGQPADTGVLIIDAEKKQIRVLDTREKEGEILHITEEPVENGTKVTGIIDWERRFDMMQNHSGEHIVSGLIHEKFGYQNVGFHMGADFITIDFNGELTAEDLQEIEDKANRVVWANETVDITSYSEEEVKAVEYRSKKELHGIVRIVTFPGADVCACCGTHVSLTGEIGLIKLISVQKFKSGVRAEMLCGRRALQYVSQICSQNQQISVALSAKPMETAQAVERLKVSYQESQFRVGALEIQRFHTIAEQNRDAGDVILFEEQLSADGVRKLAAELVETCGGFCAVFSGDDKHGYKYAVGKKDGDLRTLVKDMNSALNGRGGGKPFFAQGSVSASKKEVEEFISSEKTPTSAGGEYGRNLSQWESSISD